MYGVLLLTVFTDLILAVGIGVFIANLLTIKELSAYQARYVRVISVPGDAVHLTAEENDLMQRARDRVVLFHLSGPMMFGVAKAISREHAAMAAADALIIDLEDVPIMSTTVALAVENMALEAQSAGASIFVSGARGESRKRLESLGMFELEALTEAESRVDALRQSVTLIESKDS